jgi:hypothetical protein
VSSETTIAVAIDAGNLPMGGGLLALVRPALTLLEPGGVLAVNSLCDGLQDDLSVWCKVQQHDYLGHERAPGISETGTTRHFGLVHVRHALAHDANLYQRLENAVRRRATAMAAAGGVPDALQDGLTILAAGSTSPKEVARGHDAFRGLLDEMHVNRVKRLEHAGFTPDQARTLSELHTPNFM